MFTLNAPAKINWFLNVLGRRDDGYHDIVSLMQRVTLYDSLSFERSDRLEVMTDADIPATDNLVYRAAILLKETFGITAGARIILKKEIAMSAGLGGGSSDAACTLKGLNRLWDLDLTDKELMDIGARIGSDVSFFFNGSAAVIKGRGDIVEPARVEKSHALLLVKPPIDISAAWAYMENDKTGHRGLTKGRNNIKLFCQALEESDFTLLSSMLSNDLEPCVVSRYPVVGEIKDDLLKTGARLSAMSGSGSAVFGVFDSDQDAATAGEKLSNYWCKVAKTVAS